MERDLGPLDNKPVDERTDLGTGEARVSTGRSILFKFRTNVPFDRQDKLLERVKKWTGLHHVAFFTPDSARPEVRSRAYAYLADDVNVDAIIRKLTSIPEIETASIPAERHLIW